MSSNSSFSWRAEVAAEIEPATGGGVLPYIYAVLIWKRVYTLLILDWNRVGFSREERASMNIFIVSIPNE